MAEPCFETVTDIGDDEAKLVKKASAMVSKYALLPGVVLLTLVDWTNITSRF